MTAMAIDQDAAQAHLAHLAERDLNRPTVGVRGRVALDVARHGAIETQRRPESNCRLLVVRPALELLPAVGVDSVVRRDAGTYGAHGPVSRPGSSILGVEIARDVAEPEDKHEDDQREQDTADYQGDHGLALALEGCMDGGR